MTSLTTFEHWLQHHAHLAGLIIFLTAWLEGLAVIGSFIPTAIIMPIVGGMIATGLIPLTQTWALTSLGAWLGDSCSYLLGRYYRDSIRLMWAFSKPPWLLQHSEVYFQKYGSSSIFIARFIGPIRSFVPLIGGMCQLPTLRFFPISAIACIIWAPLYLMPGWLIGHLSLPEHLSWIALAALLSVLIMQYVILSICFRFHENKINANNIWLLVYAVLLFTILCLLLPYTRIQQFNQLVLQTADFLKGASLDQIMLFMTAIAQTSVLKTYAICLSLLLLWQRNYRILITWIITIVLLIACTLLIKDAVQFPRPHNLNALWHSFSFPSGHVTKITIMLGFVLLLLPEHRYRNLIQNIVIITIMGTACSRLYLQVHWATDTLGSLLLGCIILTTAKCILNERKLSIKQSSLAYLLFAVIGIRYFVLHHQKLLSYLMLPS